MHRVQGGTKAGLGQALFRATDKLQGKYNKMTTPILTRDNVLAFNVE